MQHLYVEKRVCHENRFILVVNCLKPTRAMISIFEKKSPIYRGMPSDFGIILSVTIANFPQTTAKSAP
jgi:hypothetical protein